MKKNKAFYEKQFVEELLKVGVSQYSAMDERNHTYYCFWLTYKIQLPQVFNRLEDSGLEGQFEEYDEFGNIIKDNHYNLFTLMEE